MTKMVLGWNKGMAKQADQFGHTPLHFSSSLKHSVMEMVFGSSFWFSFSWRMNGTTELLLEANESSAYHPDKNGSFPIHVAASMGRLEVIKILLSKCGISCADLRDKQGRTFLHVAVEKRRHNIVAFACREPWLAPFLNMQDYDMNTPLHLAVTVGDLKIFANLMRNQQVCLNMANNKGQTPLDISESAINHSGFHYGSVIINFTLSQTTFRLTEKNPFHCFGNYQLYSCRMHRDGYIGYLVLPAWKVV